MKAFVGTNAAWVLVNAAFANQSHPRAEPPRLNLVEYPGHVVAASASEIRKKAPEDLR